MFIYAEVGYARSYTALNCWTFTRPVRRHLAYCLCESGTNNRVSLGECGGSMLVIKASHSTHLYNTHGVLENEALLCHDLLVRVTGQVRRNVSLLRMYPRNVPVLFFEISTANVSVRPRQPRSSTERMGPTRTVTMGGGHGPHARIQGGSYSHPDGRVARGIIVRRHSVLIHDADFTDNFYCVFSSPPSTRSRYA